ncbi:ATP-binding protein [Candidatus Nitrososphaera evergladensis]|nr:ATP-binding protein [Candidatus Nitrososphaera evergladensis]
MTRSTTTAADDEDQEGKTEVRHGYREMEEGIEPEKTEIIQGVENVVALAETISQIRERLDTCMDSNGVSSVATNLYEKLARLKEKGVKLRYITEVTRGNVPQCKKLLNAVELRHLQGIKGNFGIADGVDFRSSASVVGGQHPTEVIRSTARQFVKQQQYFFDMLWEKAIPAEQRIKEIEEGIEPEITEIVTGWDGIFKRNIESFSKARQAVDHCCDALVPPKIVGSPVYEAGTDFVKRGGKIRMITEITAENLPSVKELMKTQEIRHVNGFNLNFGISEAVFLAPTSVYAMSSNPQLIYSNSRDLIRQHQYLFDTLWEKAIPAEQRIKEIEEGIGPEFIETIKDPDKVLKLGYDLLKEAKSEVLVIFSSANAFLRQERAGLMRLLTKMAEGHGGVQIRIMTPIDDRIKETVEKFEEHSQQKIKVKSIEPSLQTRVTLLIVDRRYSLAVELKDDAKETSLEAMGMATYSNSKATVLSYTSIFESLWNQAELYERIKQLYEQLKAHSEMQKEFISIAAHELRTPIQPIIGLTEILNQKEGNSSEYHQLLEIINRNANRLNRLTETLLDVARIDSQSLRLNKETLDLNDTIMEAIGDMEKSMDNNNNKTTLSFLRKEKEDVFVNADRGRITQVIYNLLSNAIKFAGGGTVTVMLGKESNDDGRFAIVSVRDSGSGIDPEIVPRLFTKFASKSEKGTGLGLFISKGIVEAHGGKIWAKNNKDSRGATFAFSLPLVSK